MKINFKDNEELVKSFKKFLDDGETNNNTFQFLCFFFDEIQGRGKQIWELLIQDSSYKNHRDCVFQNVVLSEQDISIKAYCTLSESYKEFTIPYEYFDDDFFNEIKSKFEKKEIESKKQKRISIEKKLIEEKEKRRLIYEELKKEFA